jgi:hypothetical protein
MNNPLNREKYKGSIEAGFSMYLNKYQILEAVDLEAYSKVQKTFDDYYPCNIYFILKRPKITINKDSFKLMNKSVFLSAQVQVKNELLKIPLEFEFFKGFGKMEFYCEYPYHTFLIERNGVPFLGGKIAVFIDEYIADPIDLSILDYEVLYIGQAYGKNGKRTALNRLSNHSTLQEILNETLSSYPDSDISILLANFQQVLYTAMGAGNPKQEKDITEDEIRFKNFSDKETFSFTEKMKINFTEAALINYFKPKYNQKYKNNFPDKSHNSYQKCYDLDLKSMIIELDTSESKRRLFSDVVVERKNYHKQYPSDQPILTEVS